MECGFRNWEEIQHSHLIRRCLRCIGWELHWGIAEWEYWEKDIICIKRWALDAWFALAIDLY